MSNYNDDLYPHTKKISSSNYDNKGMNMNRGFSFLEVMIALALISMLGAIGFSIVSMGSCKDDTMEECLAEDKPDYECAIAVRDTCESRNWN